MTDSAEHARSDERHPDAMSDQEALRVLGLERDGRPLDPQLLRRAREHARTRPGVRAALADLAAIGEVLASEPAAQPSPGFTERVLAARARPDPTAGRILRLASRLSVAAALLLVLAVGSDLAAPERAVADPDLQDQPHTVDVFRSGLRGGDDLAAGLAALLPDPAPRSSARARQLRQAAAADSAASTDSSGAAPGDAGEDDTGR